MSSFFRSELLSLDAISVLPKTGNPSSRLLVVLHGWGANAQDLASLAPMFNLPDYRMVFPNAPFPNPHAPGGKAWYDLENRDFSGLTESRQLLTNWLKSLESSTGIPSSRTILSGFSQGGAMTLDVGLNLPLAGLCSLSGFLHSTPQITAQTLPPALIVHGRQDSVVPLMAAQQAREQLTALGVAVEYHEFDMGHEVRPAVLELMRRFILART